MLPYIWYVWKIPFWESQDQSLQKALNSERLFVVCWTFSERLLLLPSVEDKSFLLQIRYLMRWLFQFLNKFSLKYFKKCQKIHIGYYESGGVWGDKYMKENVFAHKEWESVQRYLWPSYLMNRNRPWFCFIIAVRPAAIWTNVILYSLSALIVVKKQQILCQSSVPKMRKNNGSSKLQYKLCVVIRCKT